MADKFFGTAAHEFMHLVATSHSVVNGQRTLDTWIDEGLAEAANHIYLKAHKEEIDKDKVYLQDRVQKYINNLSEIKDGFPIFKWGSTESEKLLNYSMSYLFFQFLQHHAANPKSLFKNLIASRYGDYRAIIDAMTQDENLEKWGDTGDERFQKLLVRFYATNAGVRGANYEYGDDFYRGESRNFVLKDSTYSYSNNLSRVYLDTGAGVSVNMIDKLTSFSNDCIYLSVDNDGTGEDFSGYDIKDKLIAVNYKYNLEDYVTISVTLPQSNVVDEETLVTEKPKRNISKGIGSVDIENFSIDLINSPGLIQDLDDFELSL